MRQWQPNDLFWIVRNGFKYTGHAHWVAIEREDEIWAVVAFLTQIQKLDAKAYRDLALGNVHLSQTSGAELATLESVPRASSACARCHGDGGQWPLRSCTASRPFISSPRSRPMPKANGEAESCNHWRRISPRRICVSSRTIMRVFPTRRCRQPARRGGGGAGAEIGRRRCAKRERTALRDMPQQCRALNRAALVPPQQHDGADDEERSDQKSGEGTAEPGAESLARSLGEGTHAPLSRLRFRLWHSFADPSGWDADGPQKPRPCLCL